jgi:hypothetical protein
MIHLELTDQDIDDITEALDDPATPEQNKTKLLVIRMHHEGAKHGFIAKVLSLHANTITNHLKEYSKHPPFSRPPGRPNGCFRGRPPKANS